MKRGLGLAITGGLLGTVLAATLPFGAVETRWHGLFTVGIAAIAVLFFLRPLVGISASRFFWPLLPLAALGLFLGLAQLLPLPMKVTETFQPERAAQARATAVGLEAPTEAVAASLNPGATWIALTLLGALYLVFVMTRNEATRPLFRQLLWWTLIGIGVLQAAYGLGEHLAGQPRVSGTFINKNHFALLMAMVLPLILAALALAEGATSPGFWKTLGGSAGQRALARIVVLSIALALVVAALISSESRSGIVAAAAGVALFLVQVRGLPRGRLLWTAMILLVVIAPLAVAFDPTRFLAAFAAIPAEWARVGDRMTVWVGTLDVARHYPLLGTGLGTYASVFQAYRPEAIQLTFEHAHNDYLEWIAETGLAGLPILGGALLAVGRKTFGAIARPASERILIAGASASLVAALVHSVTDFGLRLFGNALIFVAIAALLWAASDRKEPSSPRSSRALAFCGLPLAALLGFFSLGLVRADAAARDAVVAASALADVPGERSLTHATRAWRRLDEALAAPGGMEEALYAARGELGLQLAFTALFAPGASLPEPDPVSLLQESAHSFRRASIADPLDPAYYAREALAELTAAQVQGRPLISGSAWSSASQKLRVAEQLGQRRASTLELVGRVRLFAGDADNGAALMRRAMDLDPNRREGILRELRAAALPWDVIARSTGADAISRLALAELMVKAGEEKHALGEYEISARLAGYRGEPLLRYAQHLASREMLPEIAALTERLGATPAAEHARVLYLASDAAARRGDYVRSRQYGVEASSLVPDEVAYHAIVARASFALGEPDEAARVLSSLLDRVLHLGRQRFVEKEVRVSLGQALEASGQVQAAVDQYHQVLGIDPDHEQARRSLDRLVAR